MAEFTRDDLRAAASAGIVTEAQAASLLALSEARAGQRATLTGEDEPFELFRGFSEIFVSVGLVLLIAGMVGLTTLTGSPALILGLGAALCWAFATYFTRKRRMVLPSIVLVTGFAMAVSGLAAWIVARGWSFETTALSAILAMLGITAAALLAWFRVFKVPFTMFLIGLCGLAAVFAITTNIRPAALTGSLTGLFDLRQGNGLAMGTLIFGLLALAAGLWFDMRDPHRLGRMAASGFWLHMLAAPALVNTVALTLFNMGPGSYWLLALALAVVALLALVIDRRSFLTAGIGYLGFLIGYAVKQGTDLNWIWIVLILGAFVTAIGAYWTQLRAAIMRALPEFPGKRRLPPYAE